MNEENEQNEPKTNAKLDAELLSKGESDDLREDFHDEKSDERAIDADITRETKAAPSVEEPAKELNGIYALLANIQTEQEVSIIVKRLKDGQYKGEFRVPSEIDKKVDVVLWDGKPYPDALYSYIRKTYGGGRYSFQLQYGGGFQQGWTDVLNDSADLSTLEVSTLKANAKTDEQPRTIEASQPFANQPPVPNADPLDALKVVAGQIKDFKAIIDSFAPPAPPPAAAPPPPEPQPTIAERIQLILLEQSKGTDTFRELALGIAGIKPSKPVENGSSKPQGFFATIGNNIASSELVPQALSGIMTALTPIAGLVVQKMTAPAAAPGMPQGIVLPPLPPNMQQPPPIIQPPPIVEKDEPQPAPEPANETAAAPPVVFDSPVPLILPPA